MLLLAIISVLYHPLVNAFILLLLLLSAICVFFKNHEKSYQIYIYIYIGCHNNSWLSFFVYSNPSPLSVSWISNHVAWLSPIMIYFPLFLHNCYVSAIWGSSENNLWVMFTSWDLMWQFFLFNACLKLCFILFYYGSINRSSWTIFLQKEHCDWWNLIIVYIFNMWVNLFYKIAGGSKV